jgi:hypothetical protein
MRIESVGDFRKAIRSGPYAWPGGYPVYFITADGEALSFSAAKAERRNILEAIAFKDINSGWMICGADINWESNDLFCGHTGKQIESAYGDNN